MSSVPKPLMEDRKLYQSKKLSKPSKLVNRSSKRSNFTRGQSSILTNRRHERVWVACQRCRVKKTKCDKELPCKRCKDDGFTCTARSREKTEFKQLSCGYVELLENARYTLTATVQKLYTMVRNGDSWDLGEPKLNGRGQPVIHDVASKLGCIRSSLDLPDNFPEAAEDSEKAQGQIQAVQSELYLRDTRSPKCARDFSPALDCTDRVSITESDYSDLSNHSRTWSQQRQAAEIAPLTIKPVGTSFLLEGSFDEKLYSHTYVDTSHSIPSSIYSEFQTKSPMFRNNPPFSPWSVQDNCLGPVHPLDLTAHFLGARKIECKPLLGCRTQSWEADPLKCMQLSNCSNLVGSTIQTPIVGQSTGFDVSDQMGSII